MDELNQRNADFLAAVVRQYPLALRKALMRRLKDEYDADVRSLRDRRQTASQGDVQALMDRASAAIGEPLLLRSRTARQVWGRSFVLHRLVTACGWSVAAASRAIRRDHATGLHLRRKVDFFLDHPAQFPDVVPMWETFTELNNTIKI